MGTHWSRLGWAGLGRGWVWAVVFVPPPRPEAAYEPAQVLTTVPEKLALSITYRVPAASFLQS